MEGIFNGVSELDTVGFLARSPPQFITIARYWAKGTSLDTPAASILPLTLTYWADDAVLEQAEAEKMKQDFFAKAVALTGQPATSVNVTEKWKAHAGPDEDINAYSGDVGGILGPAQFWDRVCADLVEKYSKANIGAWPPSDKVVQDVMAKGSNTTLRAMVPEYERRRKLFAEFWNTQINRASNSSSTCGERIITHSTHVAPLKEKLANPTLRRTTTRMLRVLPRLWYLSARLLTPARTPRRMSIFLSQSRLPGPRVTTLCTC